MNPVYFLCHYGIDVLAFPETLPENFYPRSTFAVELKENKVELRENILEEVYSFFAMDNGDLSELHLRRAKNSIYVVSTKYYGELYFRIEHAYSFPFYYEHVKQNIDRYAFVVPVNNGRLDELCKEKSFYFIGSTDRDGEL